MSLTAGICRSPVGAGVSHARRDFGTQFVPREELRLDPRVNQGPQWLGVGVRVPPWLEEAVGRIKAFVFPWRRSQSSGDPPGAASSLLYLPAPGPSAAPGRLFTAFLHQPGGVARGSPALAGLGSGGVRGSVGPEPPGCGLVARMLGTRAGFRESLSRGDIPEGLGVQLCESNRLNKRTTPREPLFGGRGGMGVGRRAERLYRMGGWGRVSPPCWHWFICPMDGIDLTWINCGACLGIEDFYPSFSKVLGLNLSRFLALQGWPPSSRTTRPG